MAGSMETPGKIARRRGAVVAVLALLASALGPGGAAAQAPLRHAGDSQRTVAEVSAYWTPQRMANADPLGLLKAGQKPPAASADRSAPTRQSAASSATYSSFELTDTLSFPNRVHVKVFFSKPGVGNFV